MDYKLAKELKDAGFPQQDKGTLLFGKGVSLADSQKKWDENSAYAPTLEELIDACGDELTKMKREKNGWLAWNRTTGYHGNTLLISVAKLWLELNKHE